MLSYFPQIRDEESTYSIFARMQFALQPRNYEIMGKMLFNRKSEVGRLNFQSSFGYLCNNLPPTLTPATFLYKNTIFPLFTPFLTKEKQEQALKFFTGDYPDKINRCLTMSNVDGTRKYIRVCKECVKEDFNTYGEPYYRRQHEIELNRTCYKHKTALYEYTIYNYPIPRRYEDFCSVLSNSKEITIPNEFKEKFFNLSEDINTIFSLNLEDLDIETTKNKISNRIAEAGYVTINGFKLQPKLSQDFKKYYSEEFLNYISYNFDINSKSNWLRKASTNYPDANPLKFILLIRFLFGSFKEFYQYNKKYIVFKEGPYPCLNTICPEYNKLVIKSITKISKSNRQQVATFKCEHCGYAYSRKGPDKNENDIYNKTYIKEHGHLWFDKLHECADKGLSYKEMCNLFGSGYTRYLNTVSNKHKDSNLSKTDSVNYNIESNSLVEIYRCEILSFIKENPNFTLQHIFRAKQKAYKYLFKNDSEWMFNTVLSPFKITKTISKEDKIKNYWLDRDSLLVEKLLESVDKIKSENTPHKRLTIYNLQKYIGYGNLNRNRHRLPKCFQLLDNVCETVLDFQKRRINYVMREMANNNIKITATRVLYTANLENISTASQDILDYIDEKIKEHNRGNIINIKE